MRCAERLARLQEVDSGEVHRGVKSAPALEIPVRVDGLCEPINPGGVACFGYVIYRGGTKLAEGYGVVDHPDPSNNVAEYAACIRALELLAEMGLTKEPVVVQSDSQLLIRQLSGQYRVSAPRIVPLYERALMLAEKFEKIRFQWIPREENEEADGLSRRAYEEYVVKNLDAFLAKYQRYLATERQKSLMNRLGIECPPWISKRNASKLISRKLRGFSKRKS